MKQVLLLSQDPHISINGIKKVDDIDEEVKGKIIIIDVDSLGFSLLPDLKEDNLLIALTGKNIPGYVMKLSSLGFFDVIYKPIETEEVHQVIKNAMEELNARRKEKIIFLPPAPEEELKGELCEELCSIAGGYKSMKEILKLAGRAASVDTPVLITGESGTGKELFAKAIWRLSSRWQGPFIAVNCSAIPENLLEAELFGYEKGAFTGATSSKEGLIEKAHHGVLFLDEIGDMPVSIQPKLLRVLQEKKIRRLGSNKERNVNFRLICATNKDLTALIRKGEFRADLYYRIATIHIHLPPLRDRKEDLPELVNCILRKLSKEMGKKVKGYTDKFLEKITNYPWPGNIRELENALRKALALSSSHILTSKDIELNYESHEVEDQLESLIKKEVRKLIKESPGNVYHRLMDEISRLIIEEALRETKGNQVMASKLLGINRITLRRKLKQTVEN